MSKHREEFEVGLPLVDCFTACREAVATLAWRVLQQEENHLVCKEVASQGTSFTWAAQVEILLSAAGSPERRKVTLKGSIFGLGPVQSGHLKGQVGNLRNRIEIASAKSSISSPVSQSRTSLASWPAPNSYTAC